MTIKTQELSSDGSSVKEYLLGLFCYLLIRFINCTLRWKKTGLVFTDEHWSYSEPKIIAVWHGQQLFAPFCYVGFPASQKSSGKQKRRMFALSSAHSDGRIVSQVLKRFGIENVSGSSSRGGLRAMVRLNSCLQSEKTHVSITPDGPKGPLCKAKGGAVLLSSQTQAPILPIGLAYENSWTLKSWDKMSIPKPFSRAYMVGGPLIHTPHNLSKPQILQAAQELTEELNRLTIEGENFF